MTSGVVPRQVGRYQILGPIGRGGMGVVYRARTRGPADATRESALKVIHDHLASDQHFVLMFLDEMRIAMGLTHRNVVQTFDAGHEDDHYFLAMELCEGWSLAEILARLKEPLPIDLALFVGMEVASALDYAHTLVPPVIHRDVSPSNILISARGDVKLTDFGVAKAARRLSVTSADVLKGKLGYMAPEQARGQAVAASDLFALGAVLYELLSGQRIRRGSDVDAVLRGTIPPLGRVASRQIPPGLERLVAGCIASAPADRPASAAALREALMREHFAIQTAGGEPLDSHRRLEAFLGERLGPPETAVRSVEGGGTEDRDRRLARALLEHAGGEEEDAGRSLSRSELGASLTTQTDSLATESASLAVTAPVAPRPPPPANETLLLPRSAEAAAQVAIPGATRTRRGARGGAWLALVAVLVLVGAGLSVGIWVRSSGGPAALDAAQPSVRAADARFSAPPAPDSSRPAVRLDGASPAPAIDSGSATDLRARPVAPVGVDRRPSSLWALARIQGRVVWADIYLDGKRVGQSPLKVPRVPPGNHLIEARREGYSPAVRRARLKPGQELKVFLDLR